jgi:SeqA-like protein
MDEDKCMKTIQVDKEIVDHLMSHAANQGESAADILRRKLQVPKAQVLLDIDDETYAFIAARSRSIGETASDILRRELHLDETPSPDPGPQPDDNDPHTPPDAEPEFIVFRIPFQTRANPWNSRETTLVTRKGDTLRIANDDVVAHQLHTNGVPFPHSSISILPGKDADFVLESVYDPVQQGPLYDHEYGPQAQFWLRVVDNA